MTDAEPATTTGVKRNWKSGLVLALLFLSMTVPVILSGRGGPSEASDQDEHHLVVIDQFQEQWPALDIVDYPSATSPGYHAAMALVARVVGPEHDVLVIRLVNCLVGLGFVLVCWWVASLYVSGWAAMVLTLPLAMSAYVLGSAIFLTTDTAALFFVLLAMMSVMMSRVGPGRIVFSGLAGACAVGVRQIHLWIAGPIGIVGLLASPLAVFIPGLLRDHEGEPRRWGNLVASVVGASLPLGLMAWFAWKWGGLMPPVYVDVHNTGANPATFAYAFSLIGLFGVWFLPLVVDDPRALLRDKLVWASVCLGAFLALVVATSFRDPVRAFGPLWRVVRVVPDVGDRSLWFRMWAIARLCCFPRRCWEAWCWVRSIGVGSATARARARRSCSCVCSGGCWRSRSTRWRGSVTSSRWRWCGSSGCWRSLSRRCCRSDGVGGAWLSWLSCRWG
ncbi:MAG: hypothetical protein ACYTF7_08325 [Planctomycetota bacterium]|jgi:hypothetical protein